MNNNTPSQTTLTAEKVTPQQALQKLKEGNFRFITNLQANHDLLQMVNETKDGQKPFAVILSCMDSRTSAEHIFDQGLGDIFSVRIAGNIISPGILGSLEYAVAAAGSSLILVLGHTNCGAIKGACDDVKLGNLTNLLAQIRPAVEAEKTTQEERNSNNLNFVNEVSKLNVEHSMKRILTDSPVIKKMVDDGTIMLEGAMYDVATGKVKFYESENG